MTAIEKFKEIIGSLILPYNEESISGVDASAQFCCDNNSKLLTVKKLNSAFLIKLSGEEHPDYAEANDYINILSNAAEWAGLVSYFTKGEKIIFNEITDNYNNSNDFKKNFDDLYSWINTGSNQNNIQSTCAKIRKLFFPEGAFRIDEKMTEIKKLRNKRRVSITRLNEEHIKRPEYEILFTSNALLTVPSDSMNISELDINSSIKEDLSKTVNEEQLYWYDHPIQIGVSPDNNEVIYGLEKFDEALGFEEEMGIKDRDKKVDCVLSVSLTHKGLQELSGAYIETELKRNKNIKRLNVYVFTEKDTQKLLNEIFIPAADKYISGSDCKLLHKIFGVDGEYGRHYSFLKAITAFWNVLINSEIKGTFKIDLDQVFPYKELLEKTGFTVFEHLKTKLWGADGIDSNKNDVHFGMIAGALVNDNDIAKSIFTSDVKFPDKDVRGDTLIFHSTLPQALSTEAEMQTRYGEDSEIDGINTCTQRVHVTGGTNGILVESLKKYRPFTPTFIGRAEDQSYIMSVLYNNSNSGFLRYVHRDGLIMRHDKNTFASDAIKAAHTGKIIGDYIRIILFSYYAESLPWTFKEIKNAIDPFTGCFISRIPWTVVYLRLSLKAALLFESGNEEEGYEIFKMGAERLGELMESLSFEKNPLIEEFEEEKKGWDLYYEILDIVEKKLVSEDDFTMKIQKRAIQIVENCKIKI